MVQSDEVKSNNVGSINLKVTNVTSIIPYESHNVSTTTPSHSSNNGKGNVHVQSTFFSTTSSLHAKEKRWALP